MSEPDSSRREGAITRGLRRVARTEAVRRTALPIATRVVGARSWTVRRGAAEGLRIATGGSNPAYALGLSEPPVQRAIVAALRPDAIFVDVGANVGFFTLIGARAVGRHGHVYAFEPNPAARTVLEQNVAANGFGDRTSVFPWALGSAPGEAMLATRNVLTAHLAPDGDLPVEVRALDDLELPRPDLVKIDVEGSEEMVIGGMSQTLAHAGPVLVIETHDEATRVPEILNAAGYGVVWIKDAGMPHLLAQPGRMAAVVPE